MTRIVSAGSNDALEALLAAVQPFILAAANTASAAPARVVVRVEIGDVVIVAVVHESADGRARTFRSVATAGELRTALMHAVGETVTAGLNGLSLESRRNVASIIESEGGLQLEIDPVFESVTLSVVVPGFAPVVLATLRDGVTH